MSCWYHSGQEEHWWIADIILGKKNTDELLTLFWARRALMGCWFHSRDEEHRWVADFILGKKNTDWRIILFWARKDLMSYWFQPRQDEPLWVLLIQSWRERYIYELLISIQARRTLMSCLFQYVQVWHWFVVDFNLCKLDTDKLLISIQEDEPWWAFLISIQARWASMSFLFQSRQVDHWWVADFHLG